MGSLPPRADPRPISRIGSRTTALRSGRFRLRCRESPLVSGAFFCLLGFSLGKRRSKKVGPKPAFFPLGLTPPSTGTEVSKVGPL